MSCHDVGRALNSVTEIVIRQYEKGQITKDAFRIILRSCRQGVHWCDGNEDEAMQALEDAGYCGLCLEQNGEVSNIYDNDLGYPDCYKVFDRYDTFAAHYFVCHNCREQILESLK